MCFLTQVYLYCHLESWLIYSKQCVMFVHTSWECCSSQPYKWVTFPEFPSQVPFNFCHRFLSPWFRFRFAHTVPASRMPKKFTVAKCCRKKKEISVSWATLHNLEQVSVCTSQLLGWLSLLPAPHPDHPGYQAPRQPGQCWDLWIFFYPSWLLL